MLTWYHVSMPTIPRVPVTARIRRDLQQRARVKAAIVDKSYGEYLEDLIAADTADIAHLTDVEEDCEAKT